MSNELPTHLQDDELAWWVSCRERGNNDPVTLAWTLVIRTLLERLSKERSKKGE